MSFNKKNERLQKLSGFLGRRGLFEESKLTKDLSKIDSEFELSLDGIRRGNYYGSSWLDRVSGSGRLSQKHKEAMSKIAQERVKFKPGDQVKVVLPHRAFEAVVLSVLDIRADGEPPMYEVFFFDEGKNYTKVVMADSLFANPDGRVPLVPRPPGDQEIPDSIEQEVSSADEDKSLKPFWNHYDGYFTFPYYEYGIYGEENDLIVKSLKNRYWLELSDYFCEFFNKNIIPVIRDAAVFALSKKRPLKLISPCLYSFIKENYPKYWTSVINDIVIRGQDLSAIPEGKAEEVYDAFREQILPVIFSYSGYDFSDLLYTVDFRQESAQFGFLLKRLHSNQAPEFKKYLRNNIDKLSSVFIAESRIYTIFPEETKNKMLMYLRHKADGDLKKIIEVSSYIPEAVELMRRAFQISFGDILRVSASDFLELFSLEKRQTLYPLLLENKPFSVFFPIYLANTEGSKAGRTINKIVSEVPQSIWNQMALKSFEEDIEYFFKKDFMEFIPFSAEVLKKGYDHLLDNRQEANYNFKQLIKAKGLKGLIKKYGLTYEQFLDVCKHLDEEELSASGVLLPIAQKYTAFVVKKIEEGEELSSSDADFISKYFDVRLYESEPDGYQTLNAFLATPQAKQWAEDEDVPLGGGKAIFSHIYKSKEPFLSEPAFFNLMYIASEMYFPTEGNPRPERAFIDWMPMSKLVGEPSEELLRFYAEIMIKEKPVHLFVSSGKSKIDLIYYLADSNLDDEEFARQILIGVSPEDIKKIIEDQPEAFKQQMVKSFREKALEEKEKVPLIKRFPDLLIPAIKRMTFTPDLLDTELLRYINIIYPSINEIPESLADTIYSKIFRENSGTNDIIKVLYKNEHKLISILKELFPVKHDVAVRTSSIIRPALFLNSPYGMNRSEYDQEIFRAINSLTWDITSVDLSDEFKVFVYQAENEDILRALINRALDLDKMSSLIYIWPDIRYKASGLGIRTVTARSMREVKDFETAKDMYKNLRNFPNIEDLPEKIKISKSIHQNEQRPDSVKGRARYTISNNNVNPTPVLYDIGKKLIHAGDGVAHTNVGISGFTNSWALTSFVEVQEEEGDGFQDTILIEQYQSDYPPVLFRLFRGKSSGKYGTGNAALKRLIKQYGDQEAIQQYIEEMISSNNRDIPEEKLDMRLDSFDFTSRTANNLARAGLSKVRQLVDYSKIDLLRTGLFGRKSVNEIEDVMQDNGTPLQSNSLEVGDRVQINDRHPSEYGGAIGVVYRIKKRTTLDEDNYGVKFNKDPDENDDVKYFKRKDFMRISISAEDIDIPIELAPMVKDARAHFENISKAYPYLAIANTIKTAQALKMQNIYIFKNAASYANIKNKDKAKKLYETIPSSVGELIHDYNNNLDLWKIPATEETLNKLYKMAQEATGKSDDYDFSLTPAQNEEIKQKRLEEKRRKKQEWTAAPEGEERLNNLEAKIRDMLPGMRVPSFSSPQDALLFLGDEIKGKVISKNKFNQQFGRLMRELGMLSRAAHRKERMIKIAAILREAKSFCTKETRL